LCDTVACCFQVAHRPIAAALPEALIAEILQHVPQQQRLQQCALVCKAWASAAALATVHVERHLKEGQTFRGFHSWLDKYAGQLVSLQLTYSHWRKHLVLQLPLFARFTKLQWLELEGFKLLLPGEGDSISIIRRGRDYVPPLLLPSLQHLQLTRVHLVSSSSLLQLAAEAPGLTSLKTSDSSFGQPAYRSRDPYGSKKAAVQQLAVVIPGVLQKLRQLAVLELPGIPMSDAAVQQLCGMQGLQQVLLEHVDHMFPSDLQPLPSNITRLFLRGIRGGTGIPDSHPSLPPQLPQLAGLLQLVLGTCNIPPTVLSAFTHLQVLKLLHCTLLPVPPDSEYHTAGTAALLDALAQMTRLQDLHLSLQELDTISTAPQRFAALTASTHLTQLVLKPDEVKPLAQGAVQHMFPAGRLLPLLQHLTISPTADQPHDWEEEEWCIDGADISRIASCCPGLRRLNIFLSVRPGGVVLISTFAGRTRHLNLALVYGLAGCTVCVDT
jgi:hypothetical protein